MASVQAVPEKVQRFNDSLNNMAFNACRFCDQAVYVNDGVFIHSAQWHKGCFKCGALAEVGCQRVLSHPSSPPYFHYFGCPFCTGCANKYFLHGRPKVYIVNPDITSSYNSSQSSNGHSSNNISNNNSNNSHNSSSGSTSSMIGPKYPASSGESSENDGGGSDSGSMRSMMLPKDNEQRMISGNTSLQSILMSYFQKITRAPSLHAMRVSSNPLLTLSIPNPPTYPLNTHASPII